MHGKIKKVFFRVIHYAIMVMITVLMLMDVGNFYAAIQRIFCAAAQFLAYPIQPG